MTELWLVLVADQFWVGAEQDPFHSRCPVDMQQSFIVGRYRDTNIHLISLAVEQLPEEAELLGLRPLLMAAEDAELTHILSRAAQLNSWFLNHRFCSRCGEPVCGHKEDFAAWCGKCGYHQYPRLSPCIIVLVTRQSDTGEQCLLAHAAHFPHKRYSTLAGFIEAGETAEQAVVREVREEVGIEIGNVRYWKSQSWPFPHSFMLAFYADYVSGELVPDGVEIIDAQWFGLDQLPEMPMRIGISHDLIEGFINGVHLHLN